jgi:hypothetical protein
MAIPVETSRVYVVQFKSVVTDQWREYGRWSDKDEAVGRMEIACEDSPYLFRLVLRVFTDTIVEV